VPSFLANLAAGHISIRYGFKGPIGTPVTACAASVQAIGDAARLIRTDEADVAICGGSEACIDLVSLGGFAAARALSTGFNETPARASRPFDRDRDGFVMGRRCRYSILLSEAMNSAGRRRADPLPSPHDPFPRARPRTVLLGVVPLSRTSISSTCWCQGAPEVGAPLLIADVRSLS
jgi:3-oxoacyl-[acyl-carrier-protein] synthase II